MKQINKSMTKYSQDSFEIHRNELFVHVYDELSSDVEVLLFLGEYSLDELFTYLNYHIKVLQASIELHDYKIIFEHQVMFYNILSSRGVEYRFFIKFYNSMIRQAKKYLYRSISNDIEHIYTKLDSEHENIIKLSTKRAKKLNEYFINEELYNIIIAGEYDKALEFSLDYVKNLESFTKYFDDILAPILFKVGSEWELGHISVAKEHLATAVIENIINSFFNDIDISKDKKGKKIVITTPEGEGHSLVIKILFKILKNLGNEVIYLSNDIPNKDLVNAIIDNKPDYLAISIILESNLISLNNLAKTLKSNEKFDGKIIVGGSALKNVSDPKNKLSVDFVCDKLQDLMKII